MFGFKKKRAKEETTINENRVDDILLRAIMGGSEITKSEALTLPAVSSAVDFISGTVAMLPIKLYRYTKNEKGFFETKAISDNDDIRIRLLNDDTGDSLDGFQFKKAMVTDYLLGKGGFAFIKKSLNKIESLHYVDEKRISIIDLSSSAIHKDYKIMVDGLSYQPFEFIKLLRNTQDGKRGNGLLDEISKALETAYHMLKYQLGLCKTGGNKRGFLTSKKQLSKEQLETLKKAWQDLYSNADNNIIVLNEGMEFKEASNTSVEMQLNQTKINLNAEINNAFHIESDYDLTIKKAINPILKAFETAINRVMLLESEKGKLFFKIDTSDLVKGSILDRFNAYKTAKQIGFMTINEMRDKETLDQIPGMDIIPMSLGDVFFDIDSGSYYTPNTGVKTDLKNTNSRSKEV